MNKYKMFMALALCCFVYAKSIDKVQYDEAQALVTLPINISTSDKDCVQMAKRVISALGDKQVSIVLKGYVTESISLREKSHALFVLQRLQRYLDRKLPGGQMTTLSLEIVPMAKMLPAWRMSTAKTIPFGYIAVIITPLDVK